MTKCMFFISILLLNGCLGVPKDIKPVSNFKLEQYLGKWYEIARLDHSFEQGLSHVSAEYSLRDDGGISVVNKGYSEKDKRWEEAKGKAYFVNDSSQGYLKVSFFGPFYGSYVIFELDKDEYNYAFVSGPNHEYLWLLSRTPTVSEHIIEKFMLMLDESKFDKENIIFVQQDENLITQ